MRPGDTAAVVVLGCFVAGPAGGASITRVPVPKGSAIEKELGYSIAVTPNGPNSGMAGTVTVEVRAPRTPRLQNLSRMILRTHQGKELTARLPLELQKGKAGEVLCHFQLAPALAKGSVLDLICPEPDMPNGVVYEIDLSAYVAPGER
jgi:hypothetical protein